MNNTPPHITTARQNIQKYIRSVSFHPFFMFILFYCKSSAIKKAAYM